MLGQRQLSTFNSQLSTIDVSGLTSGLYLLQITTKNSKVVKKITIQ
jgi:hypothetical protein